MTAGDDPRAMWRQAIELDDAGRLAEAEATYQRLLARWPDLPDGWYNLAVLQRRAGRFEAALASYQQALDRGVGRPEEVHLNRAVIYSDGLRRDAAAEAELEAALRINPGFVPALLNLANLKEDLGERDAALALYERILAIDPNCREGLARYCSLRTALGLQDPVLIDRVRDAIASPGISAADRAGLGFALGAALDRSGNYDQAFEAYVEANKQSRAAAGAQAVRYDRRQHEQFIDQLIRTFDGRHREIATAASTLQPIFICGMFRSGSTLTEQVLSGHPRVRAGGELDLLPTAVRSELAPFPQAMARMPSERLERIAGNYLQSLARAFPGAAFITDKRPDNFLYVGLIKTLFPRARIVHTTRNALDNCLSVYFLHLDHGMAYALDLMDIGHYYREHLRLMAHWKTLFGDDILEFDYDSFVREPRPSVERLLGFCGLGWDEACLAFQRTGTAVKTASVWQVRQPLYRHSSGRARHYARQLRELEAYLNEPLVL